MWFDFSYPSRRLRARGGRQGRATTGAPSELLAMVRELQPGIIDQRPAGHRRRLRRRRSSTSRDGPMSVDGQPVLWEACQTLNGSWGYDRDNLDWKSPETAGADAGRHRLQGRQPAAQRRPDRARRVRPARAGDAGGDRRVDAAARPLRSTAPGRASSRRRRDCRYTQRGDRLYLHLFAWPFGTSTCRAWPARSKYAQLLNDASEIQTHRHRPAPAAQNTTMGGAPPTTLTLELPVQTPGRRRAGDRAVPQLRV